MPNFSGYPRCLIWRRRMRTQREWNVDRSGRFSGSPDLISLPSLSCISVAALLVNVTPRIRLGVTPDWISLAIRYVITLVFPVPAPARTSRAPRRVSTADFCGGLSEAMKTNVKNAGQEFQTGYRQGNMLMNCRLHTTGDRQNQCPEWPLYRPISLVA